MLGEANAEYANVLAGLNENDKVYLSSISGIEDREVELLPEMNGKRMNKKEKAQTEPSQPSPQQRRRPQN